MVCSLYQLAEALQDDVSKAQELPSSSESSFLSAVADMGEAHSKPAADSQQNGLTQATHSSPVDLMDMVGLGPRTQETSMGLRKNGEEEVSLLAILRPGFRVSMVSCRLYRVR